MEKDEEEAVVSSGEWELFDLVRLFGANEESESQLFVYNLRVGIGQASMFT